MALSHVDSFLFLQPPINVKREAGLVSSAISQVFGINDWVSHPAYQLWCPLLNQMHHLGGNLIKRLQAVWAWGNILYISSV